VTPDESRVAEELKREEEAVEASSAPAEPVAEPDPLAEAQAKAQEYLELAQRKQAEFENFRKRSQMQAQQSELRGVVKLAKALLTPLDHLTLAVEHADEAARAPLESLRQEFIGALARVGVEAFVPQGEVFDPNQHEAMAQAPFEGREPGTVGEVYQSGYRLGEAVIRPARVVVVSE
jgi:molecular chaperone GrpE